MSGKSRRNGGGKKNQSGGRNKDALAKTDKSANSGDFDEHLSIEDKLRRDALKQQQLHMDRVRVSKGRSPKFSGGVDPEETKIVTLAGDEDDRKQLLAIEPKLILGLRIYSRNPDGSACGRTAKADEFMARHRQIRRERNNYLDQDGTHVEVGKVVRVKKGRHAEEPTMMGGERENLRRAPAVLKSIMVRAMPHEAMIAASELSGEALDAAMDRAVTEFQAATGCEIISAAVHRMSDHDLHIHIQYTMVLAQQKRLGKYSEPVQAWNKEASRLAREALSVANVKEPNPSAIGAMKKKLVKAGKLQPSPETKLVYRKVKSLRDMGSGCILGHSFRNKINLVRLAQAAGDFALGERVIAKKDDLRGFAPIAKKTDEELESKHLDLWLERVWRNAIKERLSEDALERIRAAGIEAAKNYASFGTTMPEAFDIEQRKLELEYEADELKLAAQYDAYQNDLYRYELEARVMRKIEQVKKEVRAERTELAKRKRQLDDQKAILEECEADLNKRNLSIESARESALKTLNDAKSLLAKADDLKKKAELCDHLIKLWHLILDTPGIGKLLRNFTKVWNALNELGPALGIAAKLEGIEAIKSTQAEPIQPQNNQPGDAG